MRTGQIIRKKLASGTPIGPWLQILSIRGNEVGVKYLGLQCLNNSNTSPNIDTLHRKNVYEPRTLVIPVHRNILRRINSNYQHVVTHPMMNRWKYDYSEAEIVKLYDYHGGYTWFSIDCLIQYYDPETKTNGIKVVLGQKLLQV